MQIDLLREECRAYQRYVTKHEALFSPARALPEDILRSIFLFSLVDVPSQPFLAKDNSLRGDYVRPTSAPLLLTYVCHRWREIALNMPELWTNPHITYPMRSWGRREWDPHPTTPDLLNLYVSRSSCLPISVTLEGKERDESNESWAAGKPLREAVTAGLRRCKRLTLSASSTRLMEIVTLPHSTAPLLECVDIRYDGHDRMRNPFRNQPNGICNGSAIRAIGWTGHLPANLSLLTELRVSDSENGHNLLCILAGYPLIQHVHFVVQTHSYVSTSPPATDTITLPHLHSLEISPYNAEREFFDKLHLPTLTKLSQSGIFGLWHLQQPIERYGSTILYLSLCAYMFSAKELKSVLCRLPHLEKLELSDDVGHVAGGELRADGELPSSVLTSEATMRMLTPGYKEFSRDNAEFTDSWDLRDADGEEDIAKRESEIICPKLRGITIRVTKGPPCGISDFAIYMFIQRRRNLGGDVALQAVTIIQEGVVMEGGFNVVDELRDDGVDIAGMMIHLQ
ncbi:hypothetical protein FA13DRAFT_1730993 [Coprinellus micaceus]|uniref:Uncharacterized protein n=1 Tax=Coprinellus micaceus TaxID=71717 RepID=A0A4Y7TGC9_COPMI|nr:hypothetical protein FA13DRAFT_1730993 [Coprinellus micaceus]